MSNATLNGRTVKATTKATKPTPKRTARKRIAPLQKAALFTGGIGVTALALSVIHCTTSICLLTGTHWVLGAMLAVSIDAGMVAAEVGEVLAHEYREYRKIKVWTSVYMIIAVLLSMVLNAIGSAQHAQDGYLVFSYALGAIVPVLVYLLFKVSGIMWTAK